MNHISIVNMVNMINIFNMVNMINIVNMANMINIGNMAGNTFLNMFLLGIVEGILSLYHRIIKPNLDLVMLIFRAWVPIGCVCG